MAVNYNLPKPTAGQSRGGAVDEIDLLTDLSDTVADVDTRLDAIEGGSTDASAVSYAGSTNLAATDVEAALDELDSEKVAKATFPVLLGFALSDETTAITTGTAKLTARAPFAFTLSAVRASLSTASSSGIPTVDINENGTTVLSTKLTIDANEKTSTTAATAAVISDPAIADDAELTFDIDVAGTGAKGLKCWLIGTRVLP